MPDRSYKIQPILAHFYGWALTVAFVFLVLVILGVLPRAQLRALLHRGVVFRKVTEPIATNN